MHRKITRDKIKELSRKYNIPTNRIEEIVRSQFVFVEQMMKSSNKQDLFFPGVQLLKLGKFLITPYRVKHFKEAHDANINDKST